MSAICPNVEEIILDVDLLIKYRMFDRAISTIESAISQIPRNMQLREKLCEVLIEQKNISKAIDNLLVLATLYVEVQELEKAEQFLAQAKWLNPELIIPDHLSAIKSAKSSKIIQSKKQDNESLFSQLQSPVNKVQKQYSEKILSGNLGIINLFDLIQLIENSRVTGIISVDSSSVVGRIYLNSGQIADADAHGVNGIEAFNKLADVNEGVFEVEKSAVEFKQNINAASNTNLILDVLRELDEARAGIGESSTVDCIH